LILVSPSSVWIYRLRFKPCCTKLMEAYSYSRGHDKAHEFGQESSISIISDVTLVMLLEERSIVIRERNISGGYRNI